MTQLPPQQLRLLPGSFLSGPIPPNWVQCWGSAQRSRAIPAAGVVQLTLGVLFWTGNALALVDLHQLLGILLVLGLWTLAALAHRAGVPAGLVAGAAVYGLVVPIVGFTQRELLPGSAHWVIQVIHLLLGIGLIGLAENLATRAKARLTPVA